MELVTIYGTGTCKPLPLGHAFKIDKQMGDFLVKVGRASYEMPKDETPEVGKVKVESKIVGDEIVVSIETPKKKYTRKPKEKE